MTTPDTPSPASVGREEPHPRSSVRSLIEWAAVVAGGLLLVLGWYGISGKAAVAQQLPYLASASLPGAALVVSGSVLIASDRNRRSNDNAAEMVATLYRLLAEAVEAPPEAVAAGSGTSAPGTETQPGAAVVALSDGTRFHRPDCALVHGKSDAAIVGPDTIASRGLHACPICEPPTPES